MLYTTWAYYSARHSAVTEETQFHRLNELAARKIDVFTARRAAAATGYRAAALADCACGLIDCLADAETTAQGRGITSVSNDGYSESYQATTPQQLEENLRAAAFEWLSGTGLTGAL